MRTGLVIVGWAFCVACCLVGGIGLSAQPDAADPRVEATSLLGKPLLRPEIPADRRAKLEDDLAKAKAEYDAAPESEDAAIWHGRRLAYLGRYREAIAAFSAGLEKHPESYRLLRHRGHRYVTVRELDNALTDLTRAAELIEGVPDAVEPDGAPNTRGIARSTSHSNIWYHLGLAHYLKGDFAKASEAWGRCLEFSRVNDDMLVATSYWLYLAARRAGQEAEAARVLEAIRPEMDVIENHAYHRLLLMFKGDLREEWVREGAGEGDVAEATVGYGVGAWRLIRGDATAGRAMFERVITGSNWAAFGFIAAEAEVARGGK